MQVLKHLSQLEREIVLIIWKLKWLILHFSADLLFVIGNSSLHVFVFCKILEAHTVHLLNSFCVFDKLSAEHLIKKLFQGLEWLVITTTYQTFSKATVLRYVSSPKSRDVAVSYFVGYLVHIVTSCIHLLGNQVALEHDLSCKVR